MAAKKASVDEFLSKRWAQVGKAESGNEVVFKGFKAPPSFNASARTADFVMSSERIDRDGDIVRQKGLSLTEFKKNPVALLFHSSRSWPIGNWSDVKKELKESPPRTDGRLNFLPAGGPVPEVDQSVFMVENGVMRTVSIGFMPLDLEIVDREEGSGAPRPWGFDILAAELYECSLVPIPAQPDARVKELVGKGELAPAREFLEQAFDEWAKDPRTGMFVPKKELEETYQRFFGKSSTIVMAIDAVRPAEKSALRRVEAAVAEAMKGEVTKEPVVIGVGEADDGDGGVDAISGISISISISQDGGTGGNTRVGGENGDAAPPSQLSANASNLAALSALNRGDDVVVDPKTHQFTISKQAPLGTARETPIPPQAKQEQPERRGLVDVLWRMLFGETKAPDPVKTPEPVVVPGSFKEREARIAEIEKRFGAAE